MLLISKLKLYLIYDQEFRFVTMWHQGDFIFKYDAERYLTEYSTVLCELTTESLS